MDRRLFLASSFAALCVRLGQPITALARGRWVSELVRSPQGVRVVERWVTRP